MPRYLTPLPAALAHLLQTAINQAIELDSSARARLSELGDRSVQLQLDGIGIDLFFVGRGDALEVRAESGRQPDTVIRGTPAALLAMAVPAWRSPASGVRIEGEAGSAQALERLLRRLDPDWERLAVERFGEVIGHQLWRTVRDSVDVGRSGWSTASDQVGHFLREESDLLVSRAELDHYVAEVDALREATDRLEARLRRALRQ